MNLNSESFILYSHYYDLLYEDKKYASESEYVVKSLIAYKADIHDILELGSGTGTYSSYLSQYGFNVTGLEKSIGMLEVSKSKSIPGFNGIEANIASFDLNKKFDSVVSLFHVMGYLTNNSDFNSCLNNVAKHLKPGGLFLFDVWYTPAVYTQKPQSRVKKFANEEITIIRHAEPVINYDHNTVEVTYEILIDSVEEGQEIIREKHLIRHFSTPEIEWFAHNNGLELLKAEEFLTSEAPSDKTWGVCYILKKK